MDKFHWPNHTSQYCKDNVNPYDSKKLDSLPGQNSEAAEETFAWMKGFRYIVRHMNADFFFFFLLRMCHLRNSYRLKTGDTCTATKRRKLSQPAVPVYNRRGDDTESDTSRD